MIYLSSSALMVMSNDGSKKTFDSEELQTKLINSCISAGIKDFWLAEDISNAVESALSFQAENGITFSESEINTFILKILEDTGFPSVAENYKKNNKISAEVITVNLNNIRTLFRSRFGLKEKDVLIVAEKVLTACEILKIKETQPQLIIELGRHFKNKEIKIPEFKPYIYKNISSSPWILSSEEISEMLSPETSFFIDKKMISISGVSSLFPSLKIDIMHEAMADIYKLEPVITELILFPCYRQPADAVNEIIKNTTRHLISKEIIPKKKKLPIYLRFPDIYGFSRKYLGATCPESDKFCLDTVAAGFIENLNYSVFVKGIKQQHMACPLCNSLQIEEYFSDKTRKYFYCKQCHLIYVPQEYHISLKQEKKRYDLHTNSVNDNGYRAYLSDFLNIVNSRLMPKSTGLDFGCGPGPALAEMFRESGHNMLIYDPYYANNVEVFNKKYDFITATEVVEHLANPASEIKRLWACLKKYGVLAVMTQLHEEEKEKFSRWFYIRDNTHICFFSKYTMEFIARELCGKIIFLQNDKILIEKI